MKATFLTPARTEVREIISYYNQQREGLGLEFVSELKQTLLRVRHYPLAWSPLRKEFAVVELTDFLIV